MSSFEVTKRHPGVSRLSGACTLLAMICGSFAVLPEAHGQDVPRQETVMNRERPELDALGVRMGGFKLFPELAIGATYNDNIYADDTIIFDDYVYVAQPGLELVSDWNNHEFVLGASADVMRHKDFDTEDREDYSVWSELRVDVSRSNYFQALVSWDREHEGRDSPDDRRGLEPTAFDTSDASLAFRAPFGHQKVHGDLRIRYQDWDFEDTVGPNGIISNEDRNRDRVSGLARLGVAVHRSFSLFLQGSAHTQQYDLEVDQGGFQRSSTGYEVAVGTSLDFSGRTFGDLFVGYMEEDYDDPTFDKIDGVSFGAELYWNITGLSTVSISGRRQVEPTTAANTAGRDVTRFGLGLDHELLRNMIVGVDLYTADEDFQGTDRKDSVQAAGLSFRYIMNRRMELLFEYDYRTRETEPLDSGGIEYDRNIFSLSLKGQL